MQPSWDRVAFGRVIEALRCRAASLLWHLVVVQADLLSHLAAFKDYFLMSRGELFHAFLVEARG
ncbi:gamma-tubulin complex component [Haematococcus lacustris]|uniref:Gamma-tubulin complex component n=2 Tax=Haematococcus lacustris TaxID=44745 RepID=A0A699Z443_HAELA|nr:gamma-tubulin complex component [Haematococcus lacustris]